MISKRINQISSNKEILEEEAAVHNSDLKNSVFKPTLQYSKEPVHQGAKKRRRKEMCYGSTLFGMTMHPQM